MCRRSRRTTSSQKSLMCMMMPDLMSPGRPRLQLQVSAAENAFPRAVASLTAQHLKLLASPHDHILNTC